MDFNREVREDGGGIAYNLDRKGEAFLIYNDPHGVLIKIKREGSGALPHSLSCDFTTFEKASTAVEAYLYANKNPVKKKK